MMPLPSESPSERIQRLEAELSIELNRYEQDVQEAILKKMISRLRKERHIRGTHQVFRDMVRSPLIWLLLSAGVMVPLLLYGLFVWLSLAA